MVGCLYPLMNDLSRKEEVFEIRDFSCNPIYRLNRLSWIEKNGVLFNI